jgi:phosphatidylglycerophosphate synthase
MFKVTPAQGVWIRRIPLALIGVRAGLAPLVVLLALYNPTYFAFGCALILAFLSDVFDGVIARRLNVATPKLHRLDSLADSAFYLAIVFAAWHLRAHALQEHFTALLVLAGLGIARYAFDLTKFKCEASYHVWSSKIWGITLFIGFFALLALDISGVTIALAIYIGIVADIEGLAISVVLPKWQTDVPTLVHAWRLRAAR